MPMARSQRLKSPRYNMWSKKNSEEVETIAEKETIAEEKKRRRKSALTVELALAPQSQDLDPGPGNIKSPKSTGEDIILQRAAALQDPGPETRTETGEEKRIKSSKGK